MPNAVVFDKCYLQGAPTPVLLALLEKHEIVMSAALFHELLTATPQERVKCFRRLPPGDNPVILVEGIGYLLNYERRLLQPCGKPSGHRRKGQFYFGAKVFDEGCIFTESEKSAIQDKEAETIRNIDRMIQLSEITAQEFPNLLSGSDSQRSKAVDDALFKISNLYHMQNFHRSLEKLPQSSPQPRITRNLSQWAHIRWLQVLMLFALDRYIRYNGKISDFRHNDKVKLDLEHDVHDAEILALGVLEGSLATSEKKLVRWFNLICPNGTLF